VHAKLAEVGRSLVSGTYLSLEARLALLGAVEREEGAGSGGEVGEKELFVCGVLFDPDFEPWDGKG